MNYFSCVVISLEIWQFEETTFSSINITTYLVVSYIIQGPFAMFNICFIFKCHLQIKRGVIGTDFRIFDYLASIFADIFSFLSDWIDCESFQCKDPSS